MDKKSKRIGTFKQFLKEQKIQRLNEARVSLEVEWWDSCVVEVMQDLADECNGFLDYKVLVDYVKGKFQILGRPDPGFEEGFLLQHIKDLIWARHGDSFVCDGQCNWGDNAEIQAKGLVVSELAKTILDKVLETIKTSDDPIPGVTTVSLTDKQPRVLVPMTPVVPDDEEDYMDDDLPFESKRPVKKFKEYTKALNETVAMIDCESQDDCINYCLDRIKEEVGSLDANEIVNFAFQIAPKESKTDLALDYVKALVYEYLTKQKGQVKLYGVGDPEKVKDTVPEEALKKGMLVLCDDIADQILGKIAELNGVSDGQVE